MATEAYDIVVYGNTWSAINAACAAAIEGKDLKVCLVMNYLHAGGVISNGLSELDFGSQGVKSIGWLTKEFLRRVSQSMGIKKLYRKLTPSIAELSFMAMLKHYRVTVRAPLTLASVQKTGTAITSITMTDGNIFTASRFLDGDESGDLAKMAGVTMVAGRGTASADNLLDGYSGVASEFVPFDCYASPGVLLPGFSEMPSLTIGEADARVQSYGFRSCVTNVPENRRKWPKPSGYDPLLFEYRRRELNHTNPNWRPIRIGMCLNGKADVNADFGTPLQWQWPDATPTERAALLTQIYNEQAGWYWFLANDSSVHPNVRAFMNEWSPCRDEFPGFAGTTPGWGKELYVRVSRRMVGKTVMNQIDTQVNVTKTNAVAMGHYSLDNHIVGRYATTVGGVPGYIPDSFSYRFTSEVTRFVKPYQIPYSCMLPLASECSNLLVVKAFSMSNVAASSMRIDVQTANAGAAAGVCAAYSIIAGISVDDVDALVPSVIQPKLTAYGHVWTPPA